MWLRKGFVGSASVMKDVLEFMKVDNSKNALSLAGDFFIGTAIVFDTFKDLTRNFGQTIIAVTHDEEFARNSDRVIEMRDGEVVKN
jgi:ABC-type enterochelin transport system ATPase subunit